MVKINTAFYLVIIFSSFFALLSQIFAKDKEGEFKVNKFFYIISFLIFLFYLGFRNFGIGIDDYTYKYIFINIRNSSFMTYFSNSGMEPGYLLLNKIIGLITDDFQVVIFVSAFISLFFIYKGMLYERKSTNYFLVFFLFGTIIFPYFFGIVRLSIAMSIVFYAYSILFNKNYKKYVFLILFASTFHYSALFMLLLIILNKRNVSSSYLKRIYFTLIFLLPVMFFVLSKYIVPLLSNRYSNYVINNAFSLGLNDLDKFLILLLSYIFYKSLKKITQNADVYIFLYALSIIISICSSFVSFGRIQWYFNILICFLLPLIAGCVKKYGKYKYYNLIIIPLIIIYGFMYSVKLTNANSYIVDINRYENVVLKK